MSNIIKDELNNYINDQAPDNIWDKIELKLGKQLKEDEAKSELEELAKDNQNMESQFRGKTTIYKYLPYAMTIAVCFAVLIVFGLRNISKDLTNFESQDIQLAEEASEEYAEDMAADMADEMESDMAADMADESIAENAVEEAAPNAYQESAADKDYAAAGASEGTTEGSADMKSDSKDNSGNTITLYEEIRVKVLALISTASDKAGNSAKYSMQIIDGRNTGLSSGDEILVISDVFSGNLLEVHGEYVVSLYFAEDSQEDEKYFHLLTVK